MERAGQPNVSRDLRPNTNPFPNLPTFYTTQLSSSQQPRFTMLSLTPRTTLRLAPALFRRYSTVPTAGVRISVTDSGIKVATFDEPAPAVALAVVVSSGSRAETSDT